VAEAPEVSAEDLRAAIAAGILTEAQAAALKSLADQRAGLRLSLPAEDEPFEFFRGFSEIFISIGLLILLAGFVFLSQHTPPTKHISFMYPQVAMAAVAWLGANYFTLRRRLNLPSMVLAVSFTVALSSGGRFVFEWAFGRSLDPNLELLSGWLLTTMGMAAWYARFRLPFAAFLFGVSLLFALYALVAWLDGTVAVNLWNYERLLDFDQNAVFATLTLLFGVGTFSAAMWFDLRDPHRVTRYAATAFWLHLLAATALVNTMAVTVLNLGGAATFVLLPLAVFMISVLALVIDRRSFLSAAIAYLGIMLSWVIETDNALSAAVVLIILGLFVTAIGTWWVPLRSALMRRLPDFPGKQRLPPYAEKA
jgi:hypothetical protein